MMWVEKKETWYAVFTIIFWYWKSRQLKSCAPTHPGKHEEIGRRRQRKYESVLLIHDKRNVAPDAIMYRRTHTHTLVYETRHTSMNMEKRRQDFE